MALRPWVFIHNAKHNLYNTSTSSHNAFPFLLLAISSNGVRPCDSTTLDGGLQSVIASHYVNFLQYQYIPLSTPAVHPGVKVLSQHGSWIPDRSLPTSRQHWRSRASAICKPWSAAGSTDQNGNLQKLCFWTCRSTYLECSADHSQMQFTLLTYFQTSSITFLLVALLAHRARSKGWSCCS